MPAVLSITCCEPEFARRNVKNKNIVSGIRKKHFHRIGERLVKETAANLLAIQGWFLSVFGSQM